MLYGNHSAAPAVPPAGHTRAWRRITRYGGAVPDRSPPADPSESDAVAKFARRLHTAAPYLLAAAGAGMIAVGLTPLLAGPAAPPGPPLEAVVTGVASDPDGAAGAWRATLTLRNPGDAAVRLVGANRRCHADGCIGTTAALPPAVPPGGTRTVPVEGRRTRPGPFDDALTLFTDRGPMEVVIHAPAFATAGGELFGKSAETDPGGL